MKNRTNRLIRTSIALLSCLWLGAGSPETSQHRDVPMTADQWKTVLGKPEFKEYKGKPAVVFAQEGIIAVPGFTFTNGTVEFDVEPAGMGAGLGFRMHGLESLEFLYFRPRPDCATAPDCVQYAPFTRDVLLWDMFPQYQGPAPVRLNEWNHVKMVISGRRMNLFVNGAMSPTLAIGSLEGDTRDGELALVGPGAFANFTVTPDAVEGLTGAPEADPTAHDERLVRQWQLAPSSELPDGKEPTIDDLPKASAAWRALTAERGGLVNVTRVYGLPVKRPVRSLTWLKTTVSSKTSQSKHASMGGAGRSGSS
jgi:hypothetical protein